MLLPPMIASAITDDQAVREASKQEIIRRYYKELCEYKQGRADISVVERLQRLMSNAEISPTLRPVVAAAKEKGEKLTSAVAELLTDADEAKVEEEKAAIRAIVEKLPYSNISLEGWNGDVLLEKFNSPVWEELYKPCLACGTCTFVCPTCQCYDIKDCIKLIPTSAITPIIKLRRDVWKSKRRWLSLEEALIALSISVVSNPLAEECFPYLKQLQGCEAHSTVILEDHEMQIFRKMGINLTCEPEYSFTKK